MSAQTILEAINITKTFPGVKALDNVNFSLNQGEIHALVGENGAGKSTLMNILGGVFEADSGTLRIEGSKVRFQNAFASFTHGISVVYQDLSLASDMTVAENVFANRQPVGRLNMIKWGTLYKDTLDLLHRFGETQVDPNTLVKNLPMAKQQVIEILKAISLNPKVLILDEPTSSLTKKEITRLFSNMLKLKEQGISCIYISHHLHEVFEISDRVTVLRDGKNVETHNTRDITEQNIVRLMVGRDLLDMYGKLADEKQYGDELLRVSSLSRKGSFSGISFSLKRGEILAFAGLVGAGRTEIGRAIAGIDPYDAGDIFVEGEKIKPLSPKDMHNLGVAYLTEDRKEQGLALGMAVRENVVAPSLSKYAKGPLSFVNEKKVSTFARENVSRLRITPPDIYRKTRNLSGGNQQKVLMATWLGINPKVLIVDEPTRGIDVGSKSEIYSIIRYLAASGVGIIVLSSDLPEVLGLSNRIIVMKDGEIKAELPSKDATEENVIAYATGVEI